MGLERGIRKHVPPLSFMVCSAVPQCFSCVQTRCAHYPVHGIYLHFTSMCALVGISKQECIALLNFCVRSSLNVCISIHVVLGVSVEYEQHALQNKHVNVKYRNS